MELVVNQVKAHGLEMAIRTQSQGPVTSLTPCSVPEACSSQPHLPPHYSSGTPGPVLPLGLRNRSSLFLHLLQTSHADSPLLVRNTISQVNPQLLNHPFLPFLLNTSGHLVYFVLMDVCICLSVRNKALQGQGFHPLCSILGVSNSTWHIHTRRLNEVFQLSEGRSQRHLDHSLS